jgi:hypothetical protein
MCIQHVQGILIVDIVEGITGIPKYNKKYLFSQQHNALGLEIDDEHIINANAHTKSLNLPNAPT